VHQQQGAPGMDALAHNPSVIGPAQRQEVHKQTSQRSNGSNNNSNVVPGTPGCVTHHTRVSGHGVQAQQHAAPTGERTHRGTPLARVAAASGSSRGAGWSPAYGRLHVAAAGPQGDLPHGQIKLGHKSGT
jgi:hypothetical protein